MTVLFLHIGWAREYAGAEDDIPVGTFGYMQDGGENVGEALNFRVYDGRCYGYAPQETINITRLGANPGAAYVDGILVVWTATDPAQGGRYIIGWYRNARVFANLENNRPDPQRPEILVKAAAADCHLVPVDERSFYVPSRVTGWPGIASAFFASENLAQDNLQRVIDYVSGTPSHGFCEVGEPPVAPPAQNGWPTMDAELRARVEMAAVNAAIAYYAQLGWDVRSVEQENFGWDLEARKSRRLLRIEVKGRGGLGGVELTPNEFAAMTRRETRMSYRLAIVHGSLTDTPALTIFAYVPASDRWIGPGGEELQIVERIGASASF